MSATRILTTSTIVMALLYGPNVQAQQRYAIPPPPPSYHSHEGPFFILLDSRGRIQEKEKGILDNAWRSWRGPKLEAFMICYLQIGDAVIDWTVALRGLDSVSAALKARGAASVVIPATRLCETPAASLNAGRSYVQIVGVLRA